MRVWGAAATCDARIFRTPCFMMNDLGVLLLQVQSGTRGPGISTGISATTCTSISVITISTTVKLLSIFFIAIMTGEHRRHGSYQPYKSVP